MTSRSWGCSGHIRASKARPWSATGQPLAVEARKVQNRGVRIVHVLPKESGKEKERKGLLLAPAIIAHLFEASSCAAAQRTDQASRARDDIVPTGHSEKPSPTKCDCSHLYGFE